MNLFIAQMVSLVTNYNDYISTGNIPKNYLESGVFDDCETVGFILIRNFVTRNHLNGDLVGANPVRWFKYLEKDDCLNLALHLIPNATSKTKVKRYLLTSTAHYI